MGADVQLRLFPPARPLVDRLGPGWFRALPPCSGVYRMLDESGRVLYVGKALDLRVRLASYRSTQGQARKTVRLLHQVARIDIETCPDEPSARLRENHLIRTLRPPFNRVGTWPRAALYVRVSMDDACALQIQCTREPVPGDYGAFRPGVRLACSAMQRLGWRLLHPGASAAGMPRGLMSEAGPWPLCHPAAAGWADAIRAYWSGESPGWVTRCLFELALPETPFDDAWTTHDLGVVAEFFGRGPARNLWLRGVAGVQRAQLLPEELDDLPIVAEHPAHGCVGSLPPREGTRPTAGEAGW